MKKQIFGVKAFACSDFQMIAADGGVVIGRTMDFPIDFSFDISTYPKGTAFTSHSYGKEGLSWTSKYSFVGSC